MFFIVFFFLVSLQYLLAFTCVAVHVHVLYIPWCYVFTPFCPDLPGDQHILHSSQRGASWGPGSGGFSCQSAGLWPSSARHREHEEENPGCECWIVFIFVWEHQELIGAQYSKTRWLLFYLFIYCFIMVKPCQKTRYWRGNFFHMLFYLLWL